MFRGVTYINLDAKGRMAFPSKYRDRLHALCDAEVVATIDPRDRCLSIYPTTEWDTVERNLTAIPDMYREARKLRRLMIGHATDCQLDGAGRILLPAPLRDLAGLDKASVLLGQGNKFELWNQETWEASRDDWLQETADEAALSEELQKLSL